MRTRKTAVLFEFPAEVPGLSGPKQIVLAMEVQPDGRILLREKNTPRCVAFQTTASKVFLQTVGRAFHSMPVS